MIGREKVQHILKSLTPLQLTAVAYMARGNDIWPCLSLGKDGYFHNGNYKLEDDEEDGHGDPENITPEDIKAIQEIGLQLVATKSDAPAFNGRLGFTDTAATLLYPELQSLFKTTPFRLVEVIDTLAGADIRVDKVSDFTRNLREIMSLETAPHSDAVADDSDSESPSPR
jgi:hypothetical protein